MNKTDSIGNELPKSVFLASHCSPQEFSKAMTISTFLLAANIAMSKGNNVIYDSVTKTATITDSKGFTSFISHS